MAGRLPEGSASLGVEVMVKPPAWRTPGMYTSSHWPGRNCTEGDERFSGHSQEFGERK